MMVSARSNFCTVFSVSRTLFPLSRILAVAICFAAAACTGVERPGASKTVVRDVAAEEALPSRFQQVMDRYDIPLEVPQEGKAILVNIPSYELIALEDGEPVMRSRVIVGRNSRGDRTPELDTETSVVRFRPTWRPTPMMVRSGKYEDRRWPAGPKNPLGLLAIRLEPGMLIYLHGTNQPDLFERENRALSSGCIRVERWDELAAWVLGISVEEVHQAANGASTFDMETESVPVMLRYFTEFPDVTGALRVRDDVYGRERRTAKLAAAF